MKALIKSLILLLAFYNSSIWAIDCSQTNITLTTQVAVDDFQATYGPCDTVTGNLIIQNSSLTNLAGINALTAVSATFSIRILGSLDNLDDLVNLNSVGNLYLYSMGALTDITGLSNLSNITQGTLSLYNLPNLTSLSALANAQIEFSSVSISNIDSLTDLTGLSQLSGDIERLTISNNDSLTSLNGLGAITSIDDDLYIYGNTQLSDVSALSSLTTIGDNLDLLDTSLVDLDGFSNLTSITGEIYLRNNPQLQNIDGLSGVSGTVNGVMILDNTLLNNINGLIGLTTLSNSLNIQDNPLLVNLDGLDNLISIEDDFLVAGNASLANMNALSNLISVFDNLVINNNPQLTTCDALVKLFDDIDDDVPGPGPGNAGIPDIGDRVTIRDNQASCNSVDAILLSSSLSSNVIYVDINTIADGSCTIGQCWGNAFDNLQDALAIATAGDNIWLADGVYYPDVGQAQVDNSPDHSFDLSGDISVLGGFSGNEIYASQRNANTNLVVLSADIDDNDVNIDDNNITEDTDDVVGLNAYHVFTLSGDDNLIDSLTVTAGYAYLDNRGEADPRALGGGVNCDGHKVIVDHVSFIGNLAQEKGGAMYSCLQSEISNSRFENNKSLGAGGALYLALDNTIINTQFINNSSIRTGGGFYGSGTMTDVLFENNSADIGGAILGNHGSLVVNRGKFFNNNALIFGGAISASKALQIENSLFSGNISGGNGGAIHTHSSGDFNLINSTITGNSAVNGGAIWSATTDSKSIDNSIIWNNKDTSGTGTLASSLTFINSIPTTSYSILQGSGGSSSWDLAAGTDAGNNLDTDPLFILDTDISINPIVIGNSHLNTGSPTVNAGNNSVVNTATDLDGATRILDGTVDMGAYEYFSASISINVSELIGDNVELQNNGNENLVFTVDGTQTFATEIISGNGYLISIINQPSSPDQVCIIANGSGTINGADVVVEVNCTTQYFVGGIASGIANGNSVTLNLGAEDLDVNANAAFVFVNPLTDESNYNVTISSQPTSPNQTCDITNATGTIAGDDVDDIVINCEYDDLIFRGSFE